jgi:23S rRNA pseudouridine2605 synthase
MYRHHPMHCPTFKLQKLLAQKGLGSRREMEALIATGEVSLNSKTTTLGDRAG